MFFLNDGSFHLHLAIGIWAIGLLVKTKSIASIAPKKRRILRAETK